MEAGNGARLTELCPRCKEFDYIMNHKDGISLDFLVECNHPKIITEWGGDMRVHTSEGIKTFKQAMEDHERRETN